MKKDVRDFIGASCLVFIGLVIIIIGITAGISIFTGYWNPFFVMVNAIILSIVGDKFFWTIIEKMYEKNKEELESEDA